MKIGLVDSGIGLLAAAAALRRVRADADLVLASDPEGLPWGPRSADDVTARALDCARAAASYGLDALVVACNTASVHALPALRAAFEPDLPVVGTVPAIKPAAATHGTVAIWATPATTGSAYQRALIEEFGNGAEITEVPCPGLAAAVQSADGEAVAAAVAAAAELTPAGVGAVVLGCTHYELVGELISAAVPGAALYGSADAVAAQVLRRIGAAPYPGSLTAEDRSGTLDVLLNGRPSPLPDVALAYPEGVLLAAAPATA
ncbi:glutamate racemase [Actinacidiphila acidipaludis]|uniref:Aspartate/glutamate racemase family protein n=1 Tax=Actinacidiphila acidipaludis TaxID=2873382 RepID=A0ABS7QCQ8_9ACTN|nr:aspartate/glutamate racemase family protein [Streptomyces acidipaludis]MBY8880606.1 aspartate/glutamate racemase family protein [Streptomyces acidipaludis]